MGKFVIPIYRPSIRRNPNAGNDIYLIPGREETILEIISKDFGSNKWFCTTWHGDYRTGEREVPEPKSKHIEINLNRRQNCQKVFTLSPEPEYLYEYQDATVECAYCYSRFHYSLLGEDFETGYDEDGYIFEYHINNICPVCKTKDCCQIEWEKL